MAGNFLALPGTSGPWNVLADYITGTLTAATKLTLTSATDERERAKAVLISPRGQSIRIRFTDTDPTTTDGYLVAVDDWFFFEGDLSTIELIQTAVSATAIVTFFG